MSNKLTRTHTRNGIDVTVPIRTIEATMIDGLYLLNIDREDVKMINKALRVYNMKRINEKLRYLERNSGNSLKKRERDDFVEYEIVEA